MFTMSRLQIKKKTKKKTVILPLERGLFFFRVSETDYTSFYVFVLPVLWNDGPFELAQKKNIKKKK